MLKTNVEWVVKGCGFGQIRVTCCDRLKVCQNGEVVLVPGIGGISYNVNLGDPAFGWASDHTEPGVSIHNTNKSESDSLNILSCIGNEARVMNGDAKGRKGRVIGIHGGAEDVIISFDEESMELMAPEDKIMIKCWGQGLTLLDYPEIFAQSIDPELLVELDFQENGDGTLTVPVVATVPAYLMGSGIGSINPYRGDYDIMTHDKNKIKQLGIDKLRFGDLVLLEDCDNVYGRGYLEGAKTLGVIVHANCLVTGHGPGVVSLLATQKNLLVPRIDKDANIKHALERMDNKSKQV